MDHTIVACKPIELVNLLVGPMHHNNLDPYYTLSMCDNWGEPEQDQSISLLSWYALVCMYTPLIAILVHYLSATW